LIERRLHWDRGRPVRIFPTVALFGALSLASAALADSGTPCAQSHAIVGRCFVVHGRMFFPNGNPPVRISRIGTKRILGVLDGAKRDDTDAVLPEDLRNRLGPEWDKYLVHGDFDVCPLTEEQPSRMQFVCVRDVQHAVLVRSGN
jgi:hypothetical protein